jgi:hypothetical protein
VAHGTRGGFSKFDGLQTLKPASAWTVDSFEAGAMPYFEVLGEFLDRQARFERSLPAPLAPPAADISGAQAWVGAAVQDPSPRPTARG